MSPLTVAVAVVAAAWLVAWGLAKLAASSADRRPHLTVLSDELEERS